MENTAFRYTFKSPLEVVSFEIPTKGNKTLSDYRTATLKPAVESPTENMNFSFVPATFVENLENEQITEIGFREGDNQAGEIKLMCVGLVKGGDYFYYGFKTASNNSWANQNEVYTELTFNTEEDIPQLMVGKEYSIFIER